MPVQLSLVFAATLAMLGVNVLWVSPWISDHSGPVAGNLVYMGVRLATVILFAWAAHRYFKRKRFQAVSLTALLIFLDQALFKTLILVSDWRTHPDAWASSEKSAALFGIFASYMISCPIIIVLALVGYELSAAASSKGR